MTTFATLKKTSGDLERLTKEIDKLNTPNTKTDQKDTRFWKLERDKSGNGSAIIRFLPPAAADGDDALPWVSYFDHGFQGPTGKWYIENSLTTSRPGHPNGEKDPVSEYNSQLWNSNKDENSPQRKQARNQKRRLHYVSNILVVSDPKHPENNGKVFLFKYGKKIFDKITLAMKPEFEGEKPITPFDMWKGANFKLRIRTVDSYPNYEQSVFDVPAPVADNDKEIEAIWNAQYSLNEIVAPDKFKPYDVLKKKFEDVMGLNAAPTTSETAQVRRPKAVAEVVDDAPPFEVDDEDEDLAAFKALASQ